MALATRVMGLASWGMPFAFRQLLPRRLLATAGSTSTTQEARSAQGTTRARLMAWDKVLDYTFEDPVRTVIGVGFGTDFLRLSDGDVPLGRGIGVRSPHNYLLTCFARLGLVGLMLVVALLSALLAVALSTLWTGRPDELTSLSALLVVSIFVVSMFGVVLESPATNERASRPGIRKLGAVLESPFGALPFFWAAGILLGMHRSRRQRELHARNTGRKIMSGSVSPRRPLQSGQSTPAP